MISVNAKVKKGDFRGWIQNASDSKRTIQFIQIWSPDDSRVSLEFDCIEEWQRFIDFFNITDITDMRKKPE
ncbi:hypothetical protein NBRC116592_12880 [Colwellia sp. KU-HH00111]|uniref:hypothetical protein n=1 Tax=Colwellia sp. KU-HH00111 TaxID=3127652 RepID=UPI0031064134